MCKDRTLTGDRLKRQDKRSSPDERQAIAMAWVQPCRSVGGRAAIEFFASKVKDHFGTDRAVANSGERLGSFRAKGRICYAVRARRRSHIAAVAPESLR